VQDGAEYEYHKILGVDIVVPDNGLPVALALGGSCLFDFRNCRGLAHLNKVKEAGSFIKRSAKGGAIRTGDLRSFSIRGTTAGAGCHVLKLKRWQFAGRQ
jgi:hypothetical protein